MNFSHLVKILLFMAFLLPAAAAHLAAEKIELKNGKVLEGKILDQDSGSIIVETPEGIINIQKINLKSLPPGVSPWKPTPKPEDSSLPSGEKIAPAHAGLVPEAGKNPDIGFSAAADKLKTIPTIAWAQSFAAQTAAKGRLRKIAAALHAYAAQYEKWPAGFEELIAQNMLGPEFKSGTIDNYRYEIEIISPGFKVIATPVSPESGFLTYVLDSKTGQIKSPSAS